MAFTIGIDYGTNSVRAVIVDTADGHTVATRVFDYPSGDHGVLLDARAAAPGASEPRGLRRGAPRRGRRRAEGRRRCTRIHARPGDWHRRRHHRLDAACRSTPKRGRWRSIHVWTDNLAAHAWLWKDHTSAAEAAAITETAAAHAPELLAPIGGTYSSEWWWSKIWHCLKIAPDVFDAAATWVELADFVPAVLAGVDDRDEDRALRLRRRTQGDVLRGLGRTCRRRAS